MENLEERQIQAISWLNDNQVEPNTELETLANIMGIMFISQEEGWDIME